MPISSKVFHIFSCYLETIGHMQVKIVYLFSVIKNVSLLIIKIQQGANPLFANLGPYVFPAGGKIGEEHTP